MLYYHIKVIYKGVYGRFLPYRWIKNQANFDKIDKIITVLDSMFGPDYKHSIEETTHGPETM